MNAPHWSIVPAGEWADPLAFIEAQHEQQRLLCDWLADVCHRMDVDALMTNATLLLDYLKGELGRHVRDEEDALFPALRKRCLSEDGVGGILGQLSEEHGLDEDIVAFLISDLTPLAKGVRPANPTRLFINARAFAETHRRHLNWENRVVLPLARARLTEADLEALGRAFRSGVR